MLAVLITTLLVLGLLVGSYLNSWVWRYHSQKREFPKRSICVHCAKELRWHDNVPVISFLLLKGKCRFCKELIPREYVWVELAGGLLVALIGCQAAYLGLTPIEVFRNIFFAIVLLLVFVYDAKYMEIPTGVVWLGSIIALIINCLIGHISIFNLALGMLVGWGFFYAQYVVSKGRWIGGGDVRLGVMMGTLLGWPMIVPAIGISYILGAVYALPLLILKKKTGNSAIPLGTFLAVGTLLMLLGGSSAIVI